MKEFTTQTIHATAPYQGNSFFQRRSSEASAVPQTLHSFQSQYRVEDSGVKRYKPQSWKVVTQLNSRGPSMENTPRKQPDYKAMSNSFSLIKS